MKTPEINIVAHGTELDEFDPADDAWVLFLQVFLVGTSETWSGMFQLCACSPAWLGGKGWNDEGGLWFQMFGTGYVVPWPCLILNEYDASALRRAVRDNVARCFNEASGDEARFRNSMSRFVQWEEDRPPGWSPP